MKIGFYRNSKLNRVYTKFSFDKADCVRLNITRHDMPQARLNKACDMIIITKTSCDLRKRTVTNIGFAKRGMNRRLIETLGLKESVPIFVIKHRITGDFVTILVADILDALTRPSEQPKLNLQPGVKIGKAIKGKVSLVAENITRRSLTHAQVALVAIELARWCPAGEYIDGGSTESVARNCGVDPDQVQNIRIGLFGEPTEEDRLETIISDLERLIVKIKNFL